MLKSNMTNPSILRATQVLICLIESIIQWSVYALPYAYLEIYGD